MLPQALVEFWMQWLETGNAWQDVWALLSGAFCCSFDIPAQEVVDIHVPWYKESYPLIDLTRQWLPIKYRTLALAAMYSAKIPHTLPDILADLASHDPTLPCFLRVSNNTSGLNGYYFPWSGFIWRDNAQVFTAVDLSDER